LSCKIQAPFIDSKTIIEVYLESLATIGEVSNRVDAMNQDCFDRLTDISFILQLRSGIGQSVLTARQKISVSIIIKYSATSYPPDNNMMQRTGSIDAGLAWHHILISNE
jgi:hypothetical protein